MVSVFPESEQTLANPISADDLIYYMAEQDALLDEAGSYVGGWHNSAMGRVHGRAGRGTQLRNALVSLERRRSIAASRQPWRPFDPRPDRSVRRALNEDGSVKIEGYGCREPGHGL